MVELPKNKGEGGGEYFGPINRPDCQMLLSTDHQMKTTYMLTCELQKNISYDENISIMYKI